jgi:Uma2 family endonuclease
MTAMPRAADAVRSHATYAEYLALERDALAKHEYLDGVIYATAGGTPEHSALAANVIRALGNLLADRPCQLYTSDLRVRVTATGLATYPDVSIVCGPLERAPDDANAVANPLVIVEVLSERTEAYDRGEKFAHYRRLASLSAYVLVTQYEPRVEVYTRNTSDARQWTLTAHGPGERASLSARDVELAVDDVYRNVMLPPAPPPPATR